MSDPGPLPDQRARYLVAATAATRLVAQPEVEAGWDADSVLPAFRVGDLAGHLARSVLQVEWYLDAGEVCASSPVTAGCYYGALQGADEVDSRLNVGVRQRGQEVAAGGHAALAERTAACLDRLGTRLAQESADRQVEVLGRALRLDEYLRTRMVEIAVHVEDLALSVGVNPDTTPVPDDVRREAVAVLVEAAVHRHGTAAVLRSLARRERDTVQALRVL